MQQNPPNSPSMNASSAQTTIPTSVIRPPPPNPYGYLTERHNGLLSELSYNLMTFRNTVVQADNLRLQNSQLQSLIERLTAENTKLRHANMSLIEENAKLTHCMKVEQVPKWFSFYTDPSRSAFCFGESSRAAAETSNKEEVGEVSASEPTEIAVNLCDVGTHVQGGYSPIEQEINSQGLPKTEMCNKWKYYGSCVYGDRCKFAHGMAELRPVIRPHNYRVYPCPNIMKGVPCSYEDRCSRRHNLTEEEKLQVLQKHD